jgi:aerobic C4-dicarboxylate transport protein
MKTVTGPVIFATVVIGIASPGDPLSRAGGLALRAPAYFFCATAVALTLGLLAANIAKPGADFEGGPSAEGREAAKESIAEAPQDSGIVPFFTDDLLPQSFVQPFVDNSILQLLVLAVLTARWPCRCSPPGRASVWSAPSRPPGGSTSASSG